MSKKKIIFRLCNLSCIFLLAIFAVGQQGPPPVTTPQLILPIFETNITPATQANTALVGNPGPQTIYYWMVTNFALGASSPVGPFAVTNAPNTLSGSNYVTVTPTYPAGIVSIDLLKTASPTPPFGTCNCAVATGETSGTINDQSNSTSAYTVAPINVSNYTYTLDNEVQGAGSTHAILRQNGVFVSDLSISGGFTVGGDLKANSSSSQEVIGLLNNPLPTLSVGFLNWNGTAFVFTPGGVITGSGSTNKIPLWTTPTALGSSSITDNGTSLVSTGEEVSLSGAAVNAAGNPAFSVAQGPGNFSTACSNYNTDLTHPFPLQCISAQVGFDPGSTSADITSAWAFWAELGPNSKPVSGVEASGAFTTVTSGTNAVAEARGVHAAAVANGPTTTATGIFSESFNDVSGGNLTTARAYYAVNVYAGAGAGATNSYGLFVDSPDLTSAATISHQYGVYIADQTVAGSGTNSDPWGIYEVAGKNLFGGQVLATEPTGSVWGSATGGAQGAGTLNAVGLYVNGVAVGTGIGYPTGTGIPEVTSGTSWGSTYNASNTIPANFLATIPSTQISGLGTFATQNYATPPAIGGTTPAAGTFSSLTDTAMSGGPLCVHETAGVLTTSSADCGTGGSGINITVNGGSDLVSPANFQNGTNTTVTNPTGSNVQYNVASAGASSLGLVELNTDLGGTAAAPTVVNGSHITNSSIPNSGLVNVATTVNSQTCTLGSPCTIPEQVNSSNLTSQAGFNLLTSTVNTVGLTVTPTNSGTNQLKFEISGASYTGNAATASNLSGCTGAAAGDICYYTGSAWAKLAGNSGSTNWLQETSAGVPSWTTPTGSGTVNAASQYSFGYYPNSGSATVMGGVAAPTANGLYSVSYNVTANAAVAPTASLGGVPINPQTGTTYTYLYSDRATYVSFSNASPIAATLPQAGSTGFTSNWVNVSCDIGAGTATITPTTSTISYTNGSAYISAATSMPLTTGQCAWIYSDNTNYFAQLRGGSSGGGDTITSPNSTLAIGGTSTNTTLDLAGAAGEIMAGATPALTYTPTLGKSGTAGTLSMFPATGNFTTTLGSAATASNTVNFFTAVPTNLHMAYCAVSSTTCTLTDTGYAYNAIPFADLTGVAPAFGSVTQYGVAYGSSATVISTTAALTANALIKAGSSAAPSASSVVDNGTTVTSTDTGGYVAPVFTANGTTAGFIDLPQGSTSAAVAPCNTANSHCIQAGTAVTAGVETDAPALAQGIPTRTGSSSAVTDGYSGDTNHSSGSITWGTGTSISSTTLCSTTNCPVGLYRVSLYIDVTTACTTTGSYIVWLNYTDDQGLKSSQPIPIEGPGSTFTTGVLVPLATSDYGTGYFILRSTGGTAIQYGSTAGACGSGGPAAGKFYLTVEPIA